MDYEKAYKEALERAKEIHESDYYDDTHRELTEHIFPELKNSEDEKIRRQIVAYIKGPCSCCTSEDKTNWLTWLEKQKDEAQKQFTLGMQAGREEVLYEIEKQKEQKPVEWSEEDELFLNVCKNALCKYQISDKWDANIIFKWLEGRVKVTTNNTHRKPSEEDTMHLTNAILAAEKEWGEDSATVAFLKSLRPQPKQGWSEEDEIMLRDVLGWIPAKSKPEFNQRRIDWLKNLKNRFNLQPKQDWSEKDEGMLNCLIATLCEEEHGGIITNKRFVDWLKSLRPKPHWKPTKEMLDALKWAKCEFHPDCPETMEQLQYLYSELKDVYYDGD